MKKASFLFFWSVLGLLLLAGSAGVVLRAARAIDDDRRRADAARQAEKQRLKEQADDLRGRATLALAVARGQAKAPLTEVDRAREKAEKEREKADQRERENARMAADEREKARTVAEKEERKRNEQAARKEVLKRWDADAEQMRKELRKGLERSREKGIAELKKAKMYMGLPESLRKTSEDRVATAAGKEWEESGIERSLEDALSKAKASLETRTVPEGESPTTSLADAPEQAMRHVRDDLTTELNRAEEAAGKAAVARAREEGECQIGKVLILVAGTELVKGEDGKGDVDLQKALEKVAGKLARDAVWIIDGKNTWPWYPGQKVEAGAEPFKCRRYSDAFDRLFAEGKTLLETRTAKRTVIVWKSDHNPNDDGNEEQTVKVPDDMGPVRLIWTGSRPEKGEKSQKLKVWFKHDVPKTPVGEVGTRLEKEVESR